MQLLLGIGRFVIKYLDYVLIFLLFPVVFNVDFADIKVFEFIGAMLVIRAVLPIIHNLLEIKSGGGEGIDENIKTVQNKDIDIPIQNTAATLSDDKNEVSEIFKSVIDGTNSDLKIIQFSSNGQRTNNDGQPTGLSPDQISIKKSDNEVVLSFSDFRTLRLNKHEISQLYKALLETEYTFFNPGHWTAVIKVIRQT